MTQTIFDRLAERQGAIVTERKPATLFDRQAGAGGDAAVDNANPDRIAHPAATLIFLLGIGFSLPSETSKARSASPESVER